MRQSLEERACDLAAYIIENRTTVRAAAKKFGVSKSTVHTDKTIWNGSYGWWHRQSTQYIVVNTRGQEPQLLPSISLILFTKQLSDTAVQRIRKRIRF